MKNVFIEAYEDSEDLSAYLKLLIQCTAVGW